MTVRVGIVDYLNSRPLAWGFLRGTAPAGFEARFEPPARVSDLLAAGELDVGLVPSIELQRIPDLSVLPGLCVASAREVRSVLMVAERPIAKIRRLALDVNSRTSAALVRILCAERWGIEPELVPAEPQIERMLGQSDAALVIGDPALSVDPHRWLTFDLAREWYDLTGLPFVFAVWAVRPGVDHPGLAAAFETSLAAGLAAIDEIAAEAAAKLGLPAAALKRYLEHNLHFRLGAPELAGLTEFFRRARRHRLIGEPRPLAFR